MTDMGKTKLSETVYSHKSLRNPNINYRSGWWSVTVQVAKNKSILSRPWHKSRKGAPAVRVRTEDSAECGKHRRIL